ncbi:hypothetical protein [Salidesulfovibrio onnuriiensis]|uniref:hypothetical protein n=1 Tax=Salidesulfovibrio onnuriiensis TaxID=2583823 RepID=UPI0011CAA410|nr:hypothetical protein [Salidesulfovibrio onnuriiensis]
MNPASLIPAVTPIPVHWAWIDTLLVLTFTVHILLMNALFGGGVIALFNSTKEREPLARALSSRLPTVLALVINFGVAPLLFLQTNYGIFDYTSSVFMGGWWLAVIPFLLLAYYALYVYDFRYSGMRAGRPATLVLALLFLFFIGFMFSNNMTLMLRPEAWPDYFTAPDGLLLNLKDPTLYPRFLHFMTGALAVGGLFAALVGRCARLGRAVETGMKWFVRGTVINLFLGLWFLMALPREIMLQFMGGSLWATGTLLASLCGAGLILYLGVKRSLLPAVLTTALTVLLMAVTRHFVRAFFLAPYFSTQDIPSTGQYSPMLLFLAALAAVLGVSGWMISLYIKVERRP